MCNDIAGFGGQIFDVLPNIANMPSTLMPTSIMPKMFANSQTNATVVVDVLSASADYFNINALIPMYVKSALILLYVKVTSLLNTTTVIPLLSKPRRSICGLICDHKPLPYLSK